MMSLQIADSLASVGPSVKGGVTGNIWFWVAIAEFLIILLSILTSRGYKNSRRERLSFEKGVAASDIDFSNIISDSFRAPELYKKLMRACHPDRFTDSTKKETAEELTLLISQNQYSVAEMNRLGKIAEDKLEIKIF